jgi:serine phosphatase RsbU (regulator of sigma subunit)/anti-sigma regulatory factor (Ser/Thr protein kinase)
MLSETQLYVSEYTIAADLSELPKVRSRFIDFLLTLGLGDDEKEAWKLTFTEALNNAIEHGSQNEPNSKITIRWWVSGSSIWMETEDCGKGPDASKVENPQLPEDPLSEGGRGLFIIHSFADCFEHWVSSKGYIAKIGKSYPRLNSVLPQNSEMDAILDELSDCYESLSLFDRMTENLIGDENIGDFVRSGLELFMDARDYDVMHLDMRDPSKEPEYEIMAQIEAYQLMGPTSPLQWNLLVENDSFSWNGLGHPNNFPGNSRYWNGCAVPIIVNEAVVGLIAVANEGQEGLIQSKDIRNLRAVADVLAVSLSRNQIERERDEQKRLAMEVGIATQLQRQLLPLEARPPNVAGFDLFYKSLSALEVAGDFVEVRQTSSGEYLGCVIDVMGKGVSAAILAGIFRSQFIAYAYRGGHLSSFIERSNQALATQLGDATMFITAFVFKLNTEAATISYVAAGHPPALLFRREQDVVQLESTAPPIGLFPDMLYSEQTIDLNHGDRVIIVTDGLYEWTCGDDIFGWDPMVKWFDSCRNLPAPECWERIHEKIHTARKQTGIPQEDDETLLILTRE